MNLDQIPKSKIRAFHQNLQNYKNVIDFTLGDSKDDVHDDIRKATIDAIYDGDTHYSSNAGEVELRKAIYNKYKVYDIHDIYITSGATQGLFETLFCILHKGDGLLVGIPAYPNYIKLTQLFDLDLQCFRFDENYQIDEQEIRNQIKHHTKAILINHPHNPTGTVYNQHSINIIHKLILEYHLILIWDATYYGCGDYPTLYHPSIHHQLIQIHSFSKSHQMSGFRIGYTCMPHAYIENAIKIHQIAQSCVCTFTQKAATLALQVKPRSYQKQKEYVISKLKEMNLSVLENDGPYYVYLYITTFNLDSEMFALRLLDEKQVAVLPGKYFFEDGHIRMSICISLEKCQEGCERMKEFIESL